MPVSLTEKAHLSLILVILLNFSFCLACTTYFVMCIIMYFYYSYTFLLPKSCSAKVVDTNQDPLGKICINLKEKFQKKNIKNKFLF